MDRAALLALLIWAVPASAQERALEPGARLSVLIESPNPFEGMERRGVTFDRLDGETLWVTTPDGSVALPFDAADPLVRTGGHHGGQGAVIGMLSGLAVGALTGYLGYEPEFSEDRRCDVPWPGAIPTNCRTVGTTEQGSRSLDALVGGATGFWIGLGSGYVIGRLLPKWEPVEIGSFGGSAVGLSVRVDPLR